MAELLHRTELDLSHTLSRYVQLGPDFLKRSRTTVVQTEPTLKSATVSNVNKPATLENGVTITVPPFINEGDRIRVDPTEGRYIERAK